MRLDLPVTTNEYLLRDGAVLVSKTGTKGGIAYANDDFIEASGFTQDELIGQGAQPRAPSRHAAEAFADLWRTLQAGRPWTGFVKNRRTNGDYYRLLANVTRIRRGAQAVEHMLGALAAHARAGGRVRGRVPGVPR